MSSDITPLNGLSPMKVPGPSVLASISTFTRMWTDPIQFFNKLHKQYGDVTCLNLGVKQIIILNNVQYVKYILQENATNYQKLKRLEMETKLLFGEGWTNKINRQILRPFFDPQYYAGMHTAIANSTQKMLARWQTFANNQQPFDVAEEMMNLSLSFTVKTLIGHDFDNQMDDVSLAMRAIVDHFNARAVSNFNLPDNFPTPANRRYLAAVHTVQTAVDQIIEERRHKGKDKSDLLSVLQSWRDETGTGLSPKLVRERLLWILLPAFEPIGRALSWIWYLLSLNPDVERQMQAELVQVLGGRQPTFDDLPNLNYTKMVVQETLRLYPPFWVIGREAIEDDEVGGFHIPAKAILLSNVHGLHHNPNYWDNPENFAPERFTPERSRNRPGAAFIPFSIGPRACLGYHLSMMQIQLVLATVAQAYDLKLVPEHQVEPAAMFCLLPRNGIVMTASQRR